MEELSLFSLLGVIIAPFLSVLLGLAWYHPKTMGKYWDQGMFRENESKNTIYFTTFIVNIILSITIASIASYLNISNIFDGIGLGIMIGMGLVIPVMLPTFIFAKKSTMYIFTEIAYQISNVMMLSILFSVL